LGVRARAGGVAMEQRAEKRVVRRAQRRDLLHHTDLDVYQSAYKAAMRLFELGKRFPAEERYSLTDQTRRASRSVCANIAEGWRKRRYPSAFVSKLSDAEAEAAETQVWIQFSVDCGYLMRDVGADLYREYDAILGMLVRMRTRPEDWSLSSPA
jgi:four helix bundle protein